MVRTTSRIGLGAVGILAGLCAPLAAQTLGLPASDPVGIGRGGAGVAFGQSLEATALNPALLASLRDASSAYIAAGMEMQSSQATLQANSQVLFSTDRSRFLPALGAAWKLGPAFTLGLKMDNPFMRHAQMPAHYTGRFEAQGMDLTARRLEVQGAWALTPNWSVGASLGFTRVRYAFTNAVRVPVPLTPGSPVSATNPAEALLEVNAVEEGTKSLPSYSLGFRWAINPRWTLAGAWQGAIKGDLGLKARVDDRNAILVGTSGYGAPDVVGATTAAPLVLRALSAAPGDGGITLPGKLTLGLRQRLSQVFTWEADLRYQQSSTLRIPGYASITGPSGSVRGSGMPGAAHSGFGLTLAGELALGKRVTARIGLASDPGLREDPSLEPVLGGARNASYSAGLGYRVFGGELNLGWQTRLSQDVDVRNLDGKWAVGGYSTTGTLTRVEGMGHLWSIGFKKAF